MARFSEFQSVRHVLFDAVGTVIRPDPPAPVVYWNVARQHGVELSIQEIQDRFKAAFQKHHVPGPTDEYREHERWRRFVEDVFDGWRSEEIFDELWSYFSRPQAWQVYDDVVPTVSELARRGFALGIASNFDRRLFGICESFEALGFAAHVFCSSVVGYAKPDARFFRAIERTLGASPHEILLVGDDLVKDIEGATASGWQALWIDRQSMSRSGDGVSDLRQVATLLDLPAL